MGARRCLVATVLAAVVAACAVTPEGPPGEETLSVKAWAAAEYPGAREGPELSGARCTMSNDRGSWTAITAATVTVLTSTAPLQLECIADGYKPLRASFRCVSPRELRRKRVAAVLLLPFIVVVPMTAIPSVAVGLSGQAVPAGAEPAQSSQTSYPCTYGNITAAMSRQ
jgi:hypothetical protein